MEPAESKETGVDHDTPYRERFSWMNAEANYQQGQRLAFISVYQDCERVRETVGVPKDKRAIRNIIKEIQAMRADQNEGPGIEVIPVPTEYKVPWLGFVGFPC